MDLESPVDIVTGDTAEGHVALVAGLGAGFLRIHNSEDREVAFLGGGLFNASVLAVGGSGFSGAILVKNAAGNDVLMVSGRDAEVEVHNDAGVTTVLLNGRTGDVSLLGADAAEEFEVVEADGEASPGTVLVIAGDGALRTSTCAYDQRVAGIVAGAGERRPGIVFGRTNGAGYRRPIALAGRVLCKADASSAPIEVGDLLTSASTPGNAMRASDPQRAFGAVLGKALEPLPTGQGLISVLVALQ
jgi:hypothetical protein